MSSMVIPMRRGSRTYSAKSFKTGIFQMSGTLDGYIDFVLPRKGTEQLTLDEVRALVAALNGVIADVQASCLYDRDELLAPA